jgi:ABC-type transporter Mla maintaining outer membrane lipid asymmetry ATPase subunit MlaF
LLLSFSDYAPDNAEVIFLGREWVFKEIHQSVISEQNAITLIRGGSGSGKTAILKQLALHSPFYSNKSNADTVSFCTFVNSQKSFAGRFRHRYWVASIRRVNIKFEELRVVENDWKICVCLS